MMPQIKSALASNWETSGLIHDQAVLAAFMAVRREDFILPEYAKSAYDDTPLPIIAGQTISQPTTIMIMTQALELAPGHKVLEIGAGSGYQAAIIAKVIGGKGRLITTEIIPELAEYASANLKKAGIHNAEVIQWDGSTGYAKEAPYDRIIVTAASPRIPTPLVEQLRQGGIILIPVGDSYSQKMLRGVKREKGLDIQNLGDFTFVPLTGVHGFQSGKK